jgi:hypothetical protein
VRPAGGSFGAPQDVSPPYGDASDSQLAVDAMGNAIAVWDRLLAANHVVQAAVRPAGGSFGTPQDLSVPGGAAGRPQVAVDREGDAVAVWEGYKGKDFAIWAASRPAGGRFASPQDLATSIAYVGSSQVALDAKGDAVAVWEAHSGSNVVVQAAMRAAGGNFGQPADLSAPGADAGNPQLAFDGQGNAIAVWDRFNGTSYVVQAAMRPAGGRFGTPQEISDDGTAGPYVAAGRRGDAIAVWPRWDGTHLIVQAAVHDAIPAQLEHQPQPIL